MTDKQPRVYSTWVHFNWVREEQGRFTAWKSHAMLGNPNRGMDVK